MDKTAEMKERKFKAKKYDLPDNVNVKKRIRDALFNELQMAKQALETHENEHQQKTSAKPFSCSKCDKKFAKEEHLKPMKKVMKLH